MFSTPVPNGEYRVLSVKKAEYKIYIVALIIFAFFIRLHLLRNDI
jgi:hypothetical protein